MLRCGVFCRGCLDSVVDAGLDLGFDLGFTISLTEDGLVFGILFCVGVWLGCILENGVVELVFDVGF